MNRKIVLILLLILASGSITAFISGVYIQDLSLPSASVTGYGLPLSWLKKVEVVYPNSTAHYSLSVESRLLDLAFWSLITTLPAIMIFRRKRAI